MDIIQKLKSLEQESRMRGIPIIGSEKGRWLLSFVQKNKPQHILELGTANGYSGIILGSESGEVLTIERDAKIAAEAKENFTQFKINAEVIVGDGMIVISKLVKEKSFFFDLIFIDFAKKKYVTILNDCLTLVKNGGYIIADNITMAGCQDFKQAVLTHPLLQTELINIGDGLSCSEVTKDEHQQRS